jgi:hypothetical protein
MSDSPDGASPRGTLPLGIGPIPSPAFRRLARDDRATVGPPAVKPEPQLAVDVQRSAQLPGDMAHALRPPVLRVPVRLAGWWPAPSPARLALARFAGSEGGRAGAAALGALVIVGLTVIVVTARRPELRAEAGVPGLAAAHVVPAPETPECAPPAAPISSAASDMPLSRPPRAPGKPRAPAKLRAPAKPAAGARPTDVVDPWRK